MAECYKLLVWCFLQMLMLLVQPDCSFCCPPGIIERGYEVVLSVDCSQSNPIVTYTKNSSSTLSIVRSYYQCTNSTSIQLIGEEGILSSRPRVIPVNEELSEGTICSFHGCYRVVNDFFLIQPVNCTVDINECEVNPPNCSENSHCVDRVGNFTCDCDSGYEGNGFNYCEDVDECNDTQLNNCSENATCENGIGNYSCECNEGYEGNGFTCSDIDECEINNTCGENEDCINTNGSYSCYCHSGYIDSGFNYCQDVDECNDTQLNSCSENATCINGIGNYSCECNEGYEGNGFNCSENNNPSAIQWVLIIPPVFAALVVVATVLIIICCVSNKFQERCRKRSDRLPFEKGFWGVTDLNFNPIEPQRLSISSERSELDMLDWNAPDTPVFSEKEISLVFLAKYTSIDTLGHNPSEPEVSSIQSDSIEQQSNKVEDDSTSIQTRQLGSEVDHSMENSSDHDITECGGVQQLPNNASGFSHSTDGYVIPDESQTTHHSSTYNDSGFAFQDGHLSDDNHLRDSEPDVRSYYSTESPSSSCTSPDELIYPGCGLPSIVPKSLSSSTPRADYICAMDLNDNELVSLDKIQGVSSSITTQSGRQSSPHLQTVSATEDQENYLSVASDVTHDGYISMHNSPLPPITELAV